MIMESFLQMYLQNRSFACSSFSGHWFMYLPVCQCILLIIQSKAIYDGAYEDYQVTYFNDILK